MNTIILHWTAGQNIPNDTERQHYHFLVDSAGKVHKGNLKPEDNENCQDGKYAAHCGGGNTGSIGVALCGMRGYESPQKLGKYPLTKKQCESAFKLCAELCKKYNIPTTKVITHKDFGLTHPKTSSYGKIDICWLPYPKEFNTSILEFIQAKINWYYQQIEG
jgi:N-acetyl-anhydromuramyl-L-alanine amidase AmpD